MTRTLFLFVLFTSLSFSSFGQVYSSHQDSLVQERLGFIDTLISFNPYLSVELTYVSLSEGNEIVEQNQIEFETPDYSRDFQKSFIASHPELKIAVENHLVRIAEKEYPHPERDLYPASIIDTAYENLNMITVKWVWDEGGGYSLVNYITGANNFMFGPPCISPDNNFAVGVNCDLDAGYSPSGFEFCSISQEFIDQHPPFRTRSWGPQKFTWLSDTKGIAYCEMLDITPDWRYGHFYLKVVVLRDF